MGEPDYRAIAKRLSDTLLMLRPFGGSECLVKVAEDKYLADPEYFQVVIHNLCIDLHRMRKLQSRAALARARGSRP